MSSWSTADHCRKRSLPTNLEKNGSICARIHNPSRTGSSGCGHAASEHRPTLVVFLLVFTYAVMGREREPAWATVPERPLKVIRLVDPTRQAC